MKRKTLSQEGLKAIACVSMLLDHVGVALGGGLWLRAVGRLAFPIFCFLLSEGIVHTKNPGKYALRLGISAVVSEFAFDWFCSGGVNLASQSVMITLLLAFLMGLAACRVESLPGKILVLAPFVILAEILRCDYGGYGVMTVAVFLFTREAPHCRRIQCLLLGMLCLLMPSARMGLLPLQLAGVLAMIPICCYSGGKKSHSRALQAAFYLFYPVHLLVLGWITVGFF